MTASVFCQKHSHWNVKVDLWQGELTDPRLKLGHRCSNTVLILLDYSTVRLEKLCGFVVCVCFVVRKRQFAEAGVAILPASSSWHFGML